MFNEGKFINKEESVKLKKIEAPINIPEDTDKEDFYNNLTSEQTQKIQESEMPVFKEIIKIPKEVALSNLTEEQLNLWQRWQEKGGEFGEEKFIEDLKKDNPDVLFKSAAEYNVTQKRLEKTGIKMESEKTGAESGEIKGQEEVLSEEEIGKKIEEANEKLRSARKELGITGENTDSQLFSYAIDSQMLKRGVISEDKFKEEFIKLDNKEKSTALFKAEDNEAREIERKFLQFEDDVIRGIVMPEEFKKHLDEEIDKLLIKRANAKLGINKENPENSENGFAGLSKEIEKRREAYYSKSVKESSLMRSLKRKTRLMEILGIG